MAVAAAAVEDLCCLARRRQLSRMQGKTALLAQAPGVPTMTTHSVRSNNPLAHPFAYRTLCVEKQGISRGGGGGLCWTTGCTTTDCVSRV